MGIVGKIGGFFYFAALSIACWKYPEQIQTVHINGLDISYAVRGPEKGLPVVLVHGNGGSHNSLKTQAKQLARAGYRVYSPDSRGQGVNPPLEEYHYADMAEDTYEFIRTLGLERPALWGWSDGGIIALLLEMSHPETCSMIALSGANLCPDCGPDFEEFKAWILEQNTPLTLMMLREPDIKPGELSKISVPALVTGGEKDLISPEHTKLIADSIPSSELIIYKGASHSSYIKKSPKIGRDLLKFLRKNGYCAK